MQLNVISNGEQCDESAVYVLLVPSLHDTSNCHTPLTHDSVTVVFALIGPTQPKSFQIKAKGWPELLDGVVDGVVDGVTDGLPDLQVAQGRVPTDVHGHELHSDQGRSEHSTSQAGIAK